MIPEFNLLRLFSLRCTARYQPVVLRTQIAGVHYQITPSGEKVVVSKRHAVRTEREKWQNVPVMGNEKELRKISDIEKNDRMHADPVMAKVTANEKIRQLRHRLQISGFCRDTKSYDPPSDVNERFDKVCSEILNESHSNASLRDPVLKFKLLTKCSQEFDHEVPNSDLFRMTTVDAVREFYQTPVRGKNSYDQMVQNSSNLPKNLHVIPEPIRFNPQTDTFFDGVSAFPGQRLELTGLRARKKYPTFNDNFVWPDV